MTTTKAAPVQEDTPAGRLLELISETVEPETYVVSDKIAIRPLTKADREKLHEIDGRIQTSTWALSAIIQSPNPNDEQIEQLNKLVADSRKEYDQTFFGDQYDAVQKFFATRSPHLWDAFAKDIRKKFLPSPPSNGRCTNCGNVIDLDQAVKNLASSS